MSASPAELRRMLHTYGRQLTSAKRLARFRRALRMSRAQDEVDISRQARRRALVERIAQEIMENLIVDSRENPMVGEILALLERDVGERLLFEYPLDGGDVRVLRETEAGPQEIVGDERTRILRRLWEITLVKVDATML